MGAYGSAIIPVARARDRDGSSARDGIGPGESYGSGGLPTPAVIENGDGAGLPGRTGRRDSTHVGGRRHPELRPVRELANHHAILRAVHGVVSRAVASAREICGVVAVRESGRSGCRERVGRGPCDRVGRPFHSRERGAGIRAAGVQRVARRPPDGKVLLLSARARDLHSVRISGGDRNHTATHTHPIARATAGIRQSRRDVAVGSGERQLPEVWARGAVEEAERLAAKRILRQQAFVGVVTRAARNHRPGVRDIAPTRRRDRVIVGVHHAGDSADSVHRRGVESAR